MGIFRPGTPATPTDPSAPAAPKHPLLTNIIKTYGPWIIQYFVTLLNSGVIKLPGGVTLPPIPLPPTTAPAATHAAHFGALSANDAFMKSIEGIHVEVDHAALADLISGLSGLQADTLSATG